ELFSDDDEVLFDATRPVLLTGIEDLAVRPDLADRAIILQLPVIEDARRLTERSFWERFQEARPRVLGALLAAVSWALRPLPSGVAAPAGGPPATAAPHGRFRPVGGRGHAGAGLAGPRVPERLRWRPPGCKRRQPGELHHLPLPPPVPGELPEPRMVGHMQGT